MRTVTDIFDAAELSEIATLLLSWELSLKARNRASRTIQGYVEALTLLPVPGFGAAVLQWHMGRALATDG